MKISSGSFDPTRWVVRPPGKFSKISVKKSNHVQRMFPSLPNTVGRLTPPLGSFDPHASFQPQGAYRRTKTPKKHGKKKICGEEIQSCGKGNVTRSDICTFHGFFFKKRGKTEREQSPRKKTKQNKTKRNRGGHNPRRKKKEKRADHEKKEKKAAARKRAEPDVRGSNPPFAALVPSSKSRKKTKKNKKKNKKNNVPKFLP